MTGYFIRTVSGRKFDYSLGEDNVVDVYDLAMALSKLPRFCGACEPFLSVAQHSIHVSVLMQRDGGTAEDAMHGLLHDAHEAFIGDIPTPALDFFFDETGRDFKEVLCPGIDKAILKMANLPPMTHEQEQRCKLCDLTALNLEGKRVVKGWQAVPVAQVMGDLSITPMSPEQACRSFMERYSKLKSERMRSGAR